VARRLAILCALALLASGCGVRTSKPFTAAGSAGCLRSHGFTDVTTNPGKVGFIAGFADLGGVRATSPTRNVLTIAFTADESSTGDTEDAFRAHAPKRLQSHITDIMSVNRNAVLVWTITPRSDELDTVNRCLSP
jgi:hypothetical protein